MYAPSTPTICLTMYPANTKQRAKQTQAKIVSLGFMGAISPYPIVQTMFIPQYKE